MQELVTQTGGQVAKITIPAAPVAEHGLFDLSRRRQRPRSQQIGFPHGRCRKASFARHFSVPFKVDEQLSSSLTERHSGTE